MRPPGSKRGRAPTDKLAVGNCPGQDGKTWGRGTLRYSLMGGCQGEGTRGQSQSHTLTHQRSALSVFKELQFSLQSFHFASLSSRLTVSGGTQRTKEGQAEPARGL